MRAFVSLLLLFAASTAFAAEDRSKLAVLDFKAEGVDELTTRNIQTLVAAELQQLGVFHVITTQDIVSMIDFEASRQLLGCEADTSCLAELGGALGVERTVTGSVGRIGETLVLGLALLRTDNGKVEQRLTRQAADATELAARVKQAANDLVGGLLTDLSGFLDVASSEPGAEVRLDGKLVAVTPAASIRFASGRRELRVSKQGFIDWAKEIEVPSRQQTLRVEVKLVPSPQFLAEKRAQAQRARTWAWVTTGVALAAAAGTGTFYGLARGSAEENARAWQAAEDARARDDRATFDRESAVVAQTRATGELQRNAAIGLGAVATGAAGAAVWFWLTGEDPGRYEASQP